MTLCRWGHTKRGKHCPTCDAARYAANAKSISVSDTIRRRANRTATLTAYGGSCACCGETREPFLSLDHIEGGGKQARLKLGGNSAFYTWLVRNHFPSIGLRVLCHNCNQSRGYYGYCPHERETGDQDNRR